MLGKEDQSRKAIAEAFFYFSETQRQASTGLCPFEHCDVTKVTTRFNYFLQVVRHNKNI